MRKQGKERDTPTRIFGKVIKDRKAEVATLKAGLRFRTWCKPCNFSSNKWCCNFLCFTFLGKGVRSPLPHFGERITNLMELMGVRAEELAGDQRADRVFLAALCVEMSKAGYVLGPLPKRS
jgi:hypothetical protein